MEKKIYVGKKGQKHLEQVFGSIHMERARHHMDDEVSYSFSFNVSGKKKSSNSRSIVVILSEIESLIEELKAISRRKVSAHACKPDHFIRWEDL